MTAQSLPLSRRAVIIGGGLAATAAGAYVVTPRRVYQDLSHLDLTRLFPSSLGPWSGAPAGLDVVPDVDGLRQEQIFSRIYSAFGHTPVMLVVSYHGPSTSDIKAHPPEVCYAASGFAIENLQPVDLDLGAPQPVQAQAFTGRRAERIEQVLYVTRVGRYFPRGITEERRAVLREAAQGVVADGVVFRLSSIEPSLGRAIPALAAFAQTFVQGAGAEGRAAILGPGLVRAGPVLKGPLPAGVGAEP